MDFDIEKVELGTGVSITKDLASLSNAAKSTIAIVVEGVDRAHETEKDEAALWALKSARDQINGSAHYGFRMIAAGADREVLFGLAHNKAQAFYCAMLSILMIASRPKLGLSDWLLKLAHANNLDEQRGW